MFKKIILICLVLICSQTFCYSETPKNTVITPVVSNNNSSAPLKYPKELLSRYDENFLDYYFSLPENQRTIDEINSFGNYEYNNISCFNSVYKPDTVIYPFVPKWQEKEAEYYFNEGLKMPKPKSIY